MSSHDNIENDCNGKADDLEKESRKKYCCSECDKVLQHCSSFSRQYVTVQYYNTKDNFYVLLY